MEIKGNIIEDLRTEKLHGEMNYIFEDGVERSFREFGFDSMSKERSEENIVKGDEEVGGEENFEQNKEDYNQGNAHENDDAMHGHGVKRTNSNIMGRRRFEWWEAKCDLVNDVGVFLTKGSVVACDP